MGVEWARRGGIKFYPPSSLSPPPTPLHLSYERTSQNLRRTFCQPWTLCIVGCPLVKTIAVSYLNDAYWPHDPHWLPWSCLTLMILTDYPHTLGELPYPDDPYWPPTYPWGTALAWRSLLTAHIPLGSCLTLMILADYPHTLGELPYPDNPYWLPT